jgi:Gamma-glutamyl cyclotransferase, AIG2-like
MVWYFAYGSNMDDKLLVRRVGDYVCKEPMFVENYELVFNKLSMGKGIGYANIIPCDNRVTYGIVYQLTDEQICDMDFHEGVDADHYIRIQIKCISAITQNEKVCEVYTACENKISNNLIPTKQYMFHLLAAKKYFPKDYQNFLKKQESIDIDDYRNKKIEKAKNSICIHELCEINSLSSEDDNNGTKNNDQMDKMEYYFNSMNL